MSQNFTQFETTLQKSKWTAAQPLLGEYRFARIFSFKANLRRRPCFRVKGRKFLSFKIWNKSHQCKQMWLMSTSGTHYISEPTQYQASFYLTKDQQRQLWHKPQVRPMYSHVGMHARVWFFFFFAQTRSYAKITRSTTSSTPEKWNHITPSTHALPLPP